MTNKNIYQADSIKVLKGLEAVRKRPGMYIGGTDTKAAHHLVVEILDNSIDEVINNFATHIEVELINNNTIQITDNGRGIPVDPHPKFKNKSALEIILTTLHSGGKFNSENYQTSGGSMVLSISCKCFIKVVVEVIRKKDCIGKNIQKDYLKQNFKNLRDHKKNGTKIFRPDKEILEKIFIFLQKFIFNY